MTSDEIGLPQFPAQAAEGDVRAAKVTDLTAERNKREQPDPDHMRRDQWGRWMNRYLLEYAMDGEEWGVEIWAYSQDDAEKRVAAMRQTLVLRGQIFAELPA